MFCCMEDVILVTHVIFLDIFGASYKLLLWDVSKWPFDMYSKVYGNGTNVESGLLVFLKCKVWNYNFDAQMAKGDGFVGTGKRFKL